MATPVAVGGGATLTTGVNVDVRPAAGEVWAVEFAFSGPVTCSLYDGTRTGAINPSIGLPGAATQSPAGTGKILINNTVYLRFSGTTGNFFLYTGIKL